MSFAALPPLLYPECTPSVSPCCSQCVITWPPGSRAPRSEWTAIVLAFANSPNKPSSCAKSQVELFEEAHMVAKHDPGGKVRLALSVGVKGKAVFGGPSECYRYRLSWTWDKKKPHAMFIMTNTRSAREWQGCHHARDQRGRRSCALRDGDRDPTVPWRDQWPGQLMGMLKAAMRMAFQFQHTPANLLESADRVLPAVKTSDMYATLALQG